MRANEQELILRFIKIMSRFLNFFLKPILTKISGRKPVTNGIIGFFHTEKRVILLTKSVLKKKIELVIKNDFSFFGDFFEND